MVLASISYQGVEGRTVHKIQDGSDLIFLESRCT